MLRHVLSPLARHAMHRPAPASVGALRFLNLHEYQSKDLLQKYGVNVQKGSMADTADKAMDVARQIASESEHASRLQP